MNQCGSAQLIWIIELPHGNGKLLTPTDDLMAITQILDDRDPAVVYSFGWLRAGSSNEYNATTSSANDPGLTATLVFQGVQVSVYGTLGPRNAQRPAPQSSYSVDSSAPVIYQAVQNTAVQYSMRFYASPLLPNGQHTLVLTNLGVGADSLFLDYFLIVRPDNDTTSPHLVPVSSASPSPSQTPAVEGRPSSSANTGTIVGSAIGAAALVILAVAVMLWWRGRNKRTWHDEARVTHSFRENRSIDTSPPFRQAATQSVQSTYPTSSDSAPYRPSSQQNPLTVYDPYDPSSLAPPPGYVPEQSGAGQVRLSPRQYPSKFTRDTPSPGA